MRLDRLPEHGTVVVCAPLHEGVAAKRAERAGIDYVVSDLCAPGQIFVINCDLFRADFPDEAGR